VRFIEGLRVLDEQHGRRAGEALLVSSRWEEEEEEEEEEETVPEKETIHRMAINRGWRRAISDGSAACQAFPGD